MQERFTQFTIRLSRLNKHIQKLKTVGMGQLGLKGVDTLCLYQLAACEEDLSFSQVAEQCDLDPALVSRTLRDLVRQGMVEKSGQPGRYHARYRLTPLGEEQTRRVMGVIHAIQTRADVGVCPQDLETFYTVLDQLTRNFDEMAQDPSFLTPLLAPSGPQDKEE